MSQQMTAPQNRFADWPTDSLAIRLTQTHGLGYEVHEMLSVVAERLLKLHRLESAVSAPRPMEGSETTSDESFEGRMRTIAERCDDATDISPRHARERNRALNHLFADDIPWLIAALRSSREKEREARIDAERYRYLREFLTVTKWEQTGFAQLDCREWMIPHLRKLDATVDEIVDAAIALRVSLGASEGKGR